MAVDDSVPSIEISDASCPVGTCGYGLVRTWPLKGAKTAKRSKHMHTIISENWGRLFGWLDDI